jgi:hypothetical protein
MIEKLQTQMRISSRLLHTRIKNSIYIRMKKVTLFLSSACLAFMIISCASIVSKSNWPLTVNSNPSGADITITNRGGFDVYKGTTPATLKLRSAAGFFKKESYKIKFQLNGFGAKIVPLECKVNGWYFGNILIGGLIGMLIVDPATGAMYRLDSGYINETLSTSTVSAHLGHELKVYSFNELPASFNGHLVKIN